MTSVLGDRTSTIICTSPISFDVESNNSDSNDCEPAYKNYGWQVQGLWVFELYCKRDYGVTDSRFFIVEKRDNKATLLHIIKCEIEVGSTIHSDEWRAYSTNLCNHDYMHETEIHQLHFIDPETLEPILNLKNLHGDKSKLNKP